MALRIQIAKFKFCQYFLRANSPNLMLAKLSHYTVIAFLLDLPIVRIPNKLSHSCTVNVFCLIFRVLVVVCLVAMLMSVGAVVSSVASSQVLQIASSSRWSTHLTHPLPNSMLSIHLMPSTTIQGMLLPLPYRQLLLQPDPSVIHKEIVTLK